MSAGKNEKDFIEFFQSKYKNVKLRGKKRYFDVNTKSEISVDNSLIANTYSILIEIDSANEAKLIVGQYVLLNQLYNDNKDTLFLVIHYYKQNKNKPNELEYNPKRTIKNLILINNTVYGNKGMKFCVFSEAGFKSFCAKSPIYPLFKKRLFALAKQQMNSI